MEIPAVTMEVKAITEPGNPTFAPIWHMSQLPISFSPKICEFSLAFFISL